MKLNRRFELWGRRLPPGWSIQRRNVDPTRLREGDWVRIRGHRGFRVVARVEYRDYTRDGVTEPMLHVSLVPEMTVDWIKCEYLLSIYALAYSDLRVDLYRDAR